MSLLSLIDYYIQNIIFIKKRIKTITKKKEEQTKYPPTNDLVFKKLFGEDREETKKALAFLINEIVGFKGKERVQEIKIMNPYTVSDIVKHLELDAFICYC